MAEGHFEPPNLRQGGKPVTSTLAKRTAPAFREHRPAGVSDRGKGGLPGSPPGGKEWNKVAGESPKGTESRGKRHLFRQKNRGPRENLLGEAASTNIQGE